jgi:mannose-6-phosphate isomerase class I
MKNIINTPFLDQDPDIILNTGWEAITDAISGTTEQAASDGSIFLGIDGYVGMNWNSFIANVRKHLPLQLQDTLFIDVEAAMKPQSAINRMLKPFTGTDPVFGRIYKKGISGFYNSGKLRQIVSRLKSLKRISNNRLTICYGSGAGMPMLRKQYDRLFYIDLTRQESLRRNRDWAKISGKTQSIGPKKLYYVDFQASDRHRKSLLQHIDYYIDANAEDTPKLMPVKSFFILTRALASSPFALKYIYEPGPWGGQWLRKIRDLPSHWVNCAWSFEVIAQEMSLLVGLRNEIIEIPWNTFLDLEYDAIIGDVSKRRFDGQFPIRFDYLDTMNGGDLSIQVHPTTAYIRKHFNEPYHQGEMYYIVDAKKNARVNLGLNEGIDPDKFHQAARRADEQGIPFDYHQFIHSVPVEKHDLVMIPPGTVHGSGEGNVVLEISATTYRYTFKIYDHLRPDLNGDMRPIHVRHAFNVIKWFRKSQWVDANLRGHPEHVRSGSDWTEFKIADRREFFHLVFRLEFETEIDDETGGQFHVLTLVEGSAVSLHSLNDGNKRIDFSYSETIIVPAGFGPYRILNRGIGACKVVKARLRSNH